MIERSVLALEPAAHDPDLGTGVHHGEQLVEAPLSEPRVRVQSEHELSPAHSDRDVVRCGKTEVAACVVDANTRSSRSHHLDRAVERAVVDDVDVDGALWRVPLDGLQARPEKLATAKRDDDDVDPGR